MATTSSFRATPQTRTLPDLLPAHDRTLTPAECERVARRIAGTRSLWQDVELTKTEKQTRSYAPLHEDERVEVWLLGWLPGHTTGYHDHGDSSVGFCVAQGTLVEHQLRMAEQPLERRLGPGDARSAGCDYIHCLEWEVGEPALSVHVYSPPLGAVGQYRVGDDGVLRRVIQPGRHELTRD
jgi:hypothetical protein